MSARLMDDSIAPAKAKAAKKKTLTKASYVCTQISLVGGRNVPANTVEGFVASDDDDEDGGNDHEHMVHVTHEEPKWDVKFVPRTTPQRVYSNGNVITRRISEKDLSKYRIGGIYEIEIRCVE